MAYCFTPLAGFLTTFGFGCVGLITSGVITHKYDIANPMSQYYMQMYYYRPWCRCGAYFVGFGLGLLCHYIEKQYKKQGKKFYVTAWTSTNLQLIGCVGFLFLTMVQHDDYQDGLLSSTWSMSTNIAWNVLSRPAWAFFLSLLTVSLMYGPRKGFINGFLAWDLWAPIAKLSFSAYVIHFPLLNLRVMEVSSPEHYTPWDRLELWLGHSLLSLFAAGFLWFLVEAPFATLAKMFIEWATGTGKKKKKQGGLREPLLVKKMDRELSVNQTEVTPESGTRTVVSSLTSRARGEHGFENARGIMESVHEDAGNKKPLNI